jgi:hypothetical protein
MPLAQVIQFDERQAMGRSRRVETPTACVILQFPKKGTRRARKLAVPTFADEDRIAGRGRDPG